MSGRTEPNSRYGGVIDDAHPPATRTRITRTSSLGAVPACEFTAPQDTTSRRIFQVNGARQLALVFFGTGADNSWGHAAVRGWRQFQWPAAIPLADNPLTGGQKYANVWRPAELAELKIQFGAYTVAADSQAKRDPLTAGGLAIRAADTIKTVADYTYGQTCENVDPAASPATGAADAIGVFLIDPMGNELLELELTCEVPSGESGSACTGLLPFLVRV